MKLQIPDAIWPGFSQHKQQSNNTARKNCDNINSTKNNNYKYDNDHADNSNKKTSNNDNMNES